MRFELTDLLQPLVFKTSAIDHSANLPLLVRLARIELARLASRDFKSLASTYFTTVALLFGAQGETRTHKIWLLRPTRIPIPSPGHIWWAVIELNYHSFDYESNALPLS